MSRDKKHKHFRKGPTDQLIAIREYQKQGWAFYTVTKTGTKIKLGHKAIHKDGRQTETCITIAKLFEAIDATPTKEAVKQVAKVYVDGKYVGTATDVNIPVKLPDSFNKVIPLSDDEEIVDPKGLSMDGLSTPTDHVHKA